MERIYACFYKWIKILISKALQTAFNSPLHRWNGNCQFNFRCRQKRKLRPEYEIFISVVIWYDSDNQTLSVLISRLLEAREKFLHSTDDASKFPEMILSYFHKKFVAKNRTEKGWCCLISVHALELAPHRRQTITRRYDGLLNSYPPRQNGRHFADDSLRCVFVNETLCILIKILLEFVPKGAIDNNPALV